MSELTLFEQEYPEVKTVDDALALAIEWDERAKLAKAKYLMAGMGRAVAWRELALCYAYYLENQNVSMRRRLVHEQNQLA